MTGTVITARGRALIAKAITKNTAIEFTRAAVGTGNIPTGYDPANLANLNQYQMDGKITAMSSENETAYITFQVASNDVEAGFIMTEAGIFARDPDDGEILYAYLGLADDPQYIYKSGGEVNKVAEITLGVIIGQVKNVTVVISPDGLVSRKQLEEALDGVRQDLEETRQELDQCPTSTAINTIQVVEALPEDAAQHPDTLYIIAG